MPFAPDQHSVETHPANDPYQLFKVRRRVGNAELKPVAENRMLKIILTVMPGVVITQLFRDRSGDA